MADLKGITGKILRVNLTTSEITTVEPGEEVYKKFIGGAALGTYFLLKEGIADPKVDPFGPDNMFQVMLGPINGAGPNARSVTVTKSSYNFVGVSTCGGQAASELRFAGWDGIQVVGKAEKPVYLAINDDQVEIRDASHVWGMGVDECEMILKAEVIAEKESREGLVRKADMTPEWAAIHPPKREGVGAKRLAHVWMIGPGGENQVWYASVMTEGARAHGRYGTGAIMGAKNLKAIVVRGTKGQKFADKKQFLELVDAVQQKELGSLRFRKFGTSNAAPRSSFIENGYPIRNWQWATWADPYDHGWGGPFMRDTSFIGYQSCPNCVMHCLYPVETTSVDPIMNGILSDMPDWEAMGMLAGNLGFYEMEGTTPSDPYTGTVDDKMETLAKLQYATFLHDDNGLDYVEGGALLAMLMELRQRELITVEDLDGIDLKWGDVHAVGACVNKIIHDREGIGNILRKGTWETAKYFAEKKGDPKIIRYAQTCHRYGQAAHGVRSGLDKDALEYVTASRPASHADRGGVGFMGKDYPAAIADQNGKAAVDSVVSCLFAMTQLAGSTAGMVKAATGWADFDDEELLKVGARQFCMARLFDISTMDLKDPKKDWDELVTDRWFEDPLPIGPGKTKVAYEGDKRKLFDEALPAYWKARGWSEDKGIPNADTLKDLGIDDVCEPIAKAYR